jgi:hypothetical protein
MRSRWMSTAHAAAEWKPPGRSLRSGACAVADHRVPAAHLRPAPRINVERQEPARLRGGCLQVTADHQPRGAPGLSDLYFGAPPVALGAEHRAQSLPDWRFYADCDLQQDAKRAFERFAGRIRAACGTVDTR